MKSIEEGKRVTPYDTGRVKIGLLYQPHRRVVMSADEERIQAALLGLEPRFLDRVVHALSHRPWSGLVVFVVLMGLIGLVKGGQS